MSGMLAAVFLLASFQTAVAPSPEPIQIEIELLQEVSSKNIKPGQEIPFKVLPPKTSKTAVLDPDTIVVAVATDMNPPDKKAKKPLLKLVFKPVQLSDGSLVQLGFNRPELKKMRKIGRGTEVAGAALSTLYIPYMIPFAPALAVWAFIEGKSFTVLPGEHYTVYLLSAIPGNAPELNPAAQQAPEPPSQAHSD